MIKNLFCDLDDTLFDFHRGEAAAIRETLSRVGMTPTDDVCRRYSEINRGFWRALERGEITREKLLTERFSVLFAEYGVTADAYLTQRYYENALSEQHPFLPGAMEFLQDVRKTVSLYAVTNGTAKIQRKRMTDAGITPYFNGIFISQEIGHEKPSRAFFAACFASLPDVRRDETLMLGDSLTSDMQGGVNAGILTCWFNPRGEENTAEIPIDFEVSSLADAVKLIRKLNQ